MISEQLRIDSEGIFSMSAEDYHDDPCIEPSLSSSIARVLLSSTPLHAKMRHPRLNPECAENFAKHMDLGTAGHSMLLEGVNKIEVIDAKDWRTNAAKEARDAARAKGLVPMLPHESAKAMEMFEVAKAAIVSNTDLKGLDLTEGKAEQTVIWKDTTFGIWCRIRLDFKHPRVILDLKTTGKTADPIAWGKAAIAMGYDVQTAFYLRGIRAIEPDAHRDLKFVFMVQESEPPYACSFIAISPAFYEIANDKVETAMRLWGTCLRKNEWPGYANKIYYIDPPPWAATQWNETFERLTA